MTALLLLATHLALPAPAPAGRLRPTAPDHRLLVIPLAGASGAILLLLGSIPTALAALLILLTTGRVVADVRRRARRQRREEHTAGFLGLLAGELRAGHTISAAVGHATATLPATTPTELTATLTQVSAQAGRGAPATELLIDGPPELAPLGTLWALSERHGLPLAPLVEQAQHRIDARLRHRAATAATLQGPQATAVILTLLPLAGVAMGTAMGADPLGFLTGGGLGGLLLVGGTALAAGGFLWSRHLIGRAAA